MPYKNAKDIFPPELLVEIQKYAQGERIYIPQVENIRTTWGDKNGTREAISFRNAAILKKHQDGLSQEQLSSLFCLSKDSIRKIIYKQNKTK